MPCPDEHDELGAPDRTTVLIVEDDPDFRELIERLLYLSGFSTISAPNGAEALRRLRERRPCLILLDMMMPVMSGWDFRRAQVADPELASVPVLCLTGYYDTQAVQQELGVRCLQKPIDVDVLMRAVTDVCGAPS